MKKTILTRLLIAQMPDIKHFTVKNFLGQDVTLTIRKTPLKFDYGKCVICCFNSIFGITMSSLMKNYGFKRGGSSTEEIENTIRALGKDFIWIPLHMSPIELSFSIHPNSDYICVYKNHIAHVKRNEIIDGAIYLFIDELPIGYYKIINQKL